MKMESRLLDGAMAAAAAALLVLLLYPSRPAPLPSRAALSGSLEPAGPAASPAAAGAQPSAAEVAALFTSARQAAAPAPAAPVAAPLRVPWLHYVAYVVGTSGRTSWFFKNDQSGRLLMLELQQPRDGWTLAAIQEDAWVLENGASRYLVNKR